MSSEAYAQNNKPAKILSYAIERLPEMSSGHSAVKIVDSVCLPRPRGYMFIYATCSVMALVEKATIQVIFTFVQTNVSNFNLVWNVPTS